MAGRAHLYEGHSMQAVTYGVRVLGSLGVRTMVFTNAAGGIAKLIEGSLPTLTDGFLAYAPTSR